MSLRRFGAAVRAAERERGVAPEADAVPQARQLLNNYLRGGLFHRWNFGACRVATLLLRQDLLLLMPRPGALNTLPGLLIGGLARLLGAVRGINTSRNSGRATGLQHMIGLLRTEKLISTGGQT